MKFPLKINKIEQRLLLGGIVSSLTYHLNHFATAYPQYPAELKQSIDPHIPSYADLLGDLAPPIVLQVAKKVKKSNEKIADLAFGSALYAFPNIVVRTGSQTAYVEGVKAKPAARLIAPATFSKYVPTNNSNVAITPTRSLSKYALTA